ncbi:MAG TPA: hypothetical protein DCS87_00895 [Rheinheimera sp.]|nr:hypothetical protein [Rheinheimera sp.]
MSNNKLAKSVASPTVSYKEHKNEAAVSKQQSAMPWLGQQKQQITDHFLNLLWRDLGLLTLFAVPLSLSRALHSGWISLYTVHLIIGTIVVVTALLRAQLSVALKGFIAVAVMASLGIFGLVNFGLAANGPIWMLSACVIASFVYSSRTVIVIIAVTFGIFALIGSGFISNALVAKMALDEYMQTTGAWLNFLLTSTLLVFIVGRAIKTRQMLIYAVAQHHYRQWLDDLPLALEVVDLEQQSHYRNRAAEQLFGHDNQIDAPLQLTARLLKLPLEAPLLRDELPAMQALKGLTVELPAIRLQTATTDRVVRCWGWPGYDEKGRVQYGITVFEDISAQVELDRMKNEFVANVSHELRTPLTAIRGVVGLMLGGALGDLPKPVEQMTRVCQQNTDRLLFLVNDLLDMQKIEQGKLEINSQPCAAQQLLQDIQQNMQAYAQNFGVQVVLNNQAPHAVINVDPQRFQQILANLLSNAVKFSPKGNNVVLRASTQVHQLVIEVQDTGCGIPDAFKERIFQPFSQADGSDNKARVGTGLGLSISKKLVLQMGGQLSFSSEVGIGTTFELRFPLLES